MRRFAAAVFAHKRSKPQPEHSPSTPSSSTTTSASSSSGHPSLQIPVDDHKRSSWKAWFKSSPRPSPHKKLWHQSDSSDDSRSELDHRPPLSQPPPHPPPIYPFSPRSSFPRSTHTPNSLPRPQSLRSTTLKRHLQIRLKQSSHNLTDAELRATSSLASRPPILVDPSPSTFIELAPAKTAGISLSSPGLKRWISRPCFEDRYAVFVPDQDGTILRQAVTATDFAVAALEFSQALEAMVDFDFRANVPLAPPLLVQTPPSPTPDDVLSSTMSPCKSQIFSYSSHRD